MPIVSATLLWACGQPVSRTSSQPTLVPSGAEGSAIAFAGEESSCADGPGDHSVAEAVLSPVHHAATKAITGVVGEVPPDGAYEASHCSSVACNDHKLQLRCA